MPCLIKDWILEIIAKFHPQEIDIVQRELGNFLVLEKLSNSPLTQSIQGLTFNLFEGFFVDLMGEPHSD